ncbi:Glycosyltransferase [Limosilactobacillus reuteri]|uniref:Glycosyltransferase n=1 Tax=Limosilactobacillus reuteri TaxID=1598 RepID=A0A2S1ERD3_LIMRT|nr:glycosyltransferase [Limosilactobacillus reuteri]AWD62528.1 Glycosyltransferase [Limosilactobacillus reuteri]
MKKILFVVEAMGGGVFTYIVDMANELSKNYDVSVAYGLRKQTPKDYKSYFNPSVNLIHVRNFTRSVDIKKDLAALFEIKDIENRIKPDIIHLNSSKAGVLGRIAFKNFKGPVFYTPHGYSFLMKNVSTYKRKVYYYLEKFCASFTGITIACSYGEYLTAKKITNKVTYVNNGINIDEINSFLDRIPTKKKNILTIGTLGRISTQKNPTLFNKIAKAFPSLKFKWIGDGELRSTLTSSNIEITGWLDRKDALKELNSIDIFVLPSLWEGLPISLLEAMYLRKICIVSNIAGNNNVISNNINGFICEDIQEYISIINLVKHDINSKQLLELKKNAYENIIKEYNTKIMAKKYSKIYEDNSRR